MFRHFNMNVAKYDYGNCSTTRRLRERKPLLPRKHEIAKLEASARRSTD
ncbi:MAG: hypothetical protein MZU97_06625 [Bacillus subtilis]|nr:hypothetical protein [Bacillus subtilis]